MKISARIISMLTAAALLVTPVFASSTPKTKTKAEKVVQGTVLTATNDTLIIRKGKSDLALLYDSSFQKPSRLVPGTSVLVHYRDEKTKHVITAVEVTDGKSNDGNAPAK